MKLLNKFITESLKENKLDAIKFIEEYFDKFNSNKKNFMTNKFDSTEYDFSWTIESLLNCDDIQDNFACKRLLYKINKNYKGNKILPNTNGTTYTTISIKYLKRNLKNMCGAYKFNNINKREKTPALILFSGYLDYKYITNFDKYHPKEILEDDGFLELYHFTLSEKPIVEDKEKSVTMKIFLWNDYWPIIRFDFDNIDEGLKINSNSKINKNDINTNKFIICMPYKFAELNKK